MKRTKNIIILLSILVLTVNCCLPGCSKENPQGTAADTEMRTIVDMAGRELTVPSQINKVFSTNQPGTILIYTLAPDLLIGRSHDMGEAEKKFTLPQYHELPNLGGWTATGASCNAEELLKIKPDLIISMKVINETNISEADDIQQQLNIPVVIVDEDLGKLDKTYEFTGKLLNVEKQAEILGSYCRETINQIQSKSQSIAPDKRVRVYYADGTTGLETGPSGSRHTEVLDMVGGLNVADVTAKGKRAMAKISLEQLLLWDPDLIISWAGEMGYYQQIFNDPKWQNIKAVRDKKVYAIPIGPFNWFDRPPSVNRILGLKWLANLLYPEIYNYDMAKETREFYKKFYHYDLSDEELTSLLKDSGGKQ